MYQPSDKPQRIRIFISYGHGDAADFSAKLAVWLRDQGYEPWLDVENGILNPSGNVTVIAQNSAGLQTVVSGSGVLPGDITAITDAVWDEPLSGHVAADTFGSFIQSKLLRFSTWIGLK